MDGIAYVLLAAAAASCACWTWRKRRRLDAAALAWQQRCGTLEQDLASARARLAQHKPVLDAQAHALRLTQQAEAYAARLRLETERECSALRKHVSAYLREADETLEEADQRARALTARAEQHAERIAGDALRAKAHAAQLEVTLQAMRNSIEGYGDMYLVPAGSALDHLAEDAGFSEPGARLSSARERTRRLVESGLAARCDESSTRHGQRAVQFVLDAFNGRVDSILCDLRHDNFGTLERRIRDAALLVNRNAETFDQARVLPAYVEARVSELHWAVCVLELRRREQEEQRRLREQIREEELAQIELEQTAEQAAQEGTALRTAIEEMRRGAAGATREQRARCKEQLAELHTMLIAADERRRRALALLQQPRAGTVYVISNLGSFGPDVYKIGTTRRLDPRDFVAELGDASVPFPFDVHALLRTDDAVGVLKELHRRLLPSRINRVNPHKTFFRTNLAEIRAALEAMDHPSVAWTVSAAQHEYRESLAQEEKALTESWVEEQERSQPSVETRGSSAREQNRAVPSAAGRAVPKRAVPPASGEELAS